ncbi:MAG TPA: hypothetical protein PK659_07550 [Methanothrix sp.]|nr:hypothetical protein [Methanothrix sp.]HOL44087.1 hypothetical protein [Methanothrix sp.]
MSVMNAEAVNGGGFTVVCGFPPGSTFSISQESLDKLCTELEMLFDKYGLEPMLFMDNEYALKFFWTMGQRKIEKAMIEEIEGSIW